MEGDESGGKKETEVRRKFLVTFWNENNKISKNAFESGGDDAELDAVAFAVATILRSSNLYTDATVAEVTRGLLEGEAVIGFNASLRFVADKKNPSMSEVEIDYSSDEDLEAVAFDLLGTVSCWGLSKQRIRGNYETGHNEHISTITTAYGTAADTPDPELLNEEGVESSEGISGGLEDHEGKAPID